MGKTFKIPKIVRVCSIHKFPLMANGKCSVCVYARFGRQLRDII